MAWPAPCPRHSVDERGSLVSPLAAYVAGLDYPVRPIGTKDVEHVTDQQEGISARAAVGQMKTLLGLPADASHRAVLDAVQAVAFGQPQVMTEERAERQRTARQEALHTVMDLWAQHRLGEDPPMDDLVLAAEWLSSGDLSTVLQIRKLYATGQPGVCTSTDAATWAPDHG